MDGQMYRQGMWHWMDAAFDECSNEQMAANTHTRTHMMLEKLCTKASNFNLVIPLRWGGWDRGEQTKTHASSCLRL